MPLYIMEKKTIGMTDSAIENYEMKEIDLASVEELETAIAPGIIGFGCGCNAGNIGIFCG